MKGTPVKLYQTTIVVYTDYNPDNLETDVLMTQSAWGGVCERSRNTVQVEVSDKDIVDLFDPNSWESE